MLSSDNFPEENSHPYINFLQQKIDFNVLKLIAYYVLYGQ